MKERPVVFKEEAIKKILAGRKIQTRRILNCDHPVVTGFVPNGEYGYWKGTAKSEAVIQQYISTFPLTIKCPFGIVGDRLWVRETCIISPPNWLSSNDDLNHPDVIKDSNGIHRVVQYLASNPSTDIPIGDFKLEKTKSIHMPRWASRILLEITAIRVERLNDISECDAVAEGGPKSHPSIDRVSRSLGFKNWSCSHFAQTWDWDNKVKWEANPWVWVVEFKVVQGGGK